MDIIFPLLFVLTVAVYFYYSSKANIIPSQEISTVGIFCVNAVAYCFLFSPSEGFISTNESFNQMAYMILMYAGTTKTISLLHALGKEYEAKKIYYKFIVISLVYIVIEMIFTKITLALKSNYPMIAIFLMCPLYTHFMFAMNVKTIIKNKLYIQHNEFQWIKFLTSFVTVSFIISIYEWGDLYYLVKGINIYKDYYIVHKDPTSLFDMIWLGINVIGLLIIPRIAHVKSLKGGKDETNSKQD